MLTAYLLSASVATPLIGRLGDMYGKERLLVAVLALLCVGTLVSALATSLAVLLVGRVIQGAAGGIFPLAFGIIRDEFPRERVAGGIGLMSALLGVGGGAGVVLAGPIVDHLSYHYLFWLPLVPLVLATVVTHLFVPESPDPRAGPVNWLGAALMCVGLVLVLVAVSETPTWHWLSAKTLGCIAAGRRPARALGAQRDALRQPLVDMRMMRIRGVWTTNAVALLLGFGMYASFILLPQFVETPASAGYGFGASVTGAGLFLLPVDDRDADRRLADRPAREALRLEAAAARRRASLALRVVRCCSRSRATERWEIYVAALAARRGHRPRVRGDGEPDHRERRRRARPASRPA